MIPTSRPDSCPYARPYARPGTRCNTLARLARLACLVFVCGILPLHAQTATPTPQQMVEQLKNPRTRSLRNLSVETVPAPDIKAADSAASSSSSAISAISAANASRPALSLLIQFDFNSARVRPESQQALGNLSQALQSSELASSKFAVEGHTDARGSADYNQKLSQQRALAVRDILASSGVAQDRLRAAGRGATELANSAEPFAAENRRVRIVNLD